MKVLIAIDSFKGSMTSSEAAGAVERGIRKVRDNEEITIFDMADGGEGTLESLSDHKTQWISCKTIGPLGEEIFAKYGLIEEGTVAVLEMATTSGLGLVPNELRNPMETTTYGVGILIKDALDKGIRKFIIGIGGSATNDGGVGMAQALGYEISDSDGNEIGLGGKWLKEINKIQSEKCDPRVLESHFTIACDVDNPLCGQCGAAYTYGPQKGADLAMVQSLDEGLMNLANTVKATMGKDILNIPGSGAAGGLGGGAVAFLDGHLESGFSIIAKTKHLESIIASTDIIVTGEGCVDNQTLNGKVIMGIVELAKKYNKQVIALVGCDLLTEEISNLIVFDIVDRPMSLETAMENKDALLRLEKVTTSVFKLINI